MQNLLTFFLAVIDRLRGLVGLVLPVFAEAADFRTWPTWFRVLVTVIVYAVVLSGLYWLTGRPVVQTYLKRNVPTELQPYYLPVVFVLLSVLSWVGYLLYKLLTAADAAEFPDIAAAWAEATAKLAAEGVRVGDVPVYLVVGRPASGDDALFLAAGLKLGVRAPKGDGAPVRVFGGPDGVFVTCPGASTWGRFADRLANADTSGAGASASEIDLLSTNIPGQVLAGVDQKLQDEFYGLLQDQSQRKLTADEQARLLELGLLMDTAKSAGARRVTMGSDELAAGPNRLAYLCRLVARDRAPWCPVNGLLVVVPWAALETDDLARTAVGVLSGDLAAARRELRQRYPSYVMVCDLEQAHGFDEFRRGFRAGELNARVGQRTPLVPDRPPAEVPGMMEYVADWVRQSVMPGFVLNWLRLDWPPEGRRGAAFVPPTNRKLFVFLYDVFVRAPRLGRLLAHGLPAADPVPGAAGPDLLPLVGGCYFAATGRDEKSQAFAAGVFQRLTDRNSQDAVSWSAAALAEDRQYGGRAVLLYAAAAVLALVTAAGVAVKVKGI